MQAGPSTITAAAESSFADSQNDRLREILQSLVRHLHAFAAETRLTEDEWRTGMSILAESGRLTNDQRQEFVLWSDALGMSMLVDAIANEKRPGATESTVLGPFWADGSPQREYGEAIFEQALGEPAWVHGQVLDLAGQPIAGAELDVWQNDANLLYSVQDPEAPDEHLRGRFRSREDGSFAFLGVRPVPYPIPNDGPVGKMLSACGRHPWRPAHLHVIVRAPEYETLVTHFFDAESPYLDSDAVFAVKPSLIRRFVARSPDDRARPTGVDGRWWDAEINIVLAPEAPP